MITIICSQLYNIVYFQCLLSCYINFYIFTQGILKNAMRISWTYDTHLLINLFHRFNKTWTLILNPLSIFVILDNRNHRPCCKEKGIDDYCLPLCNVSSSVSHSLPIGFDALRCVTGVQDIAGCYQEGVCKFI